MKNLTDYNKVIVNATVNNKQETRIKENFDIEDFLKYKKQDIKKLTQKILEEKESQL